MQMLTSRMPVRHVTVTVIMILSIVILPRLPFHYRTGWPEEAIFRVRIARLAHNSLIKTAESRICGGPTEIATGRTERKKWRYRVKIHRVRVRVRTTPTTDIRSRKRRNVSLPIDGRRVHTCSGKKTIVTQRDENRVDSRSQVT